jgi:ribose transport system permease protein
LSEPQPPDRTTPAEPGTASGRSELAFQARRAREAALAYVGVISVLLVLIVIFSFLQPTFLTTANFLDIAQNNAVLLIVSVGLTFTLLVAGFDLSIGGMLGLSAIVVAMLLQDGVGTIWVLIIAVLGAMLIGAFINGFLIARLDLNFFVVTLGVMLAARGIALLITNGESRGLYDKKIIGDIGTGTVGGSKVGYLVVIALGIWIAAAVVTRYTGFGRMIYAVGGNPEAARLAGINVVAVRMAAYAISAALAGLGGFLAAGQYKSATPTVYSGIELTAAAAVLIGGTSFIGGVGTMAGTLLGVAFLGILQNGTIISSINQYWYNVITGGVLVLSVLIDRFRQYLRLKGGLRKYLAGRGIKAGP